MKCRTCQNQGAINIEAAGLSFCESCVVKIDTRIADWIKLQDLNEDKFRTIAAYTRMASLDKWKIGRLIDAIDQYLSASGYSAHSTLLSEARADVINCKTGMFPDQPAITQWNPK